MIELDKDMHASTADADLDDPRAVNEVLSLLDATWLDPVVHARPTHYNIATSVVCNIKCVFCPRQTFGPEIDSGFLKAEFYEPVVPHFEAALRTGLFGLGEPFLNKKFFDFVRAAKERGTYTMTSSHGMSLTGTVIEKVLDCGLDELWISFDGTNPRTVNFLRNGADFVTIRDNVGRLLQRRRERNQKRPRVHISMTVSKYNVWEMASMVRLVHRLGADQCAFSNLTLDHPEHGHVSAVGTRVFQFNLKRAFRLAEKLGVKVTFFPQIPFPFEEQPQPATRPDQRWGCPDAWRQVIVEKDGKMKPCCYLATSYGNSAETDVAEAINSDAAVAFRRTFIDQKYLNKCRGCGQFYQITDAEMQEILDEVARRIAAGSFSEAQRILLEEKHGYFTALFERSRRQRRESIPA